MRNIISFNFKKGSVELVSRVNNGTDEVHLRITEGYGAVVTCGEIVATVTSEDFDFAIDNLVGSDSLTVTVGAYSFQIKKTKNLKGVYLNQISEFVYELSNQTEDGSDYEKLKDKPSINGVTLEGNKTSEQLGLMSAGVDFVTHLELDAGLNRKQNKLYAGEGIKIEGDLISVLSEGNAKYKEVTMAEYEALPDSKYTDGIIYFVKNYEEHTIQNGELTVRKYGDGTIVWYFNGYHWIDDGVGDIVIPDELVPFLPPNPLGQNEVYVAVTSSYYADERHPSYGERDGWLGFRYNYPRQGDVYVMSYTQSWYSNNCVDNARLIVGEGQPEGSAGETQVTEYIPPDEDYTIEGGNLIILNGIAYAGSGQVSITPRLSSGTKIADFTVNGTSGSLYAPSGGGGGGSTTVLFTTGSAVSSMTLNDDLFNYDLIQINIVDGNGYTRGVAFAPSTLAVNQIIGFDNTYGYSWNQITSGTQLDKVASNNFFIGSIVGVKL